MQKGDSDSKHRDSRFGTRLGLGIGLEIQSCLSLGLGLDSKTRSFWSQTRNRVSKTGTRETLFGCFDLNKRGRFCFSRRIFFADEDLRLTLSLHLLIYQVCKSKRENLFSPASCAEKIMGICNLRTQEPRPKVAKIGIFYNSISCYSPDSLKLRIEH